MAGGAARIGAVLSVLAAAGAGGCVETVSRADATGSVAGASSAATWQMPWQIAPVSAGAEAGAEPTLVSWVPGTGFVRGTSSALAEIGRPLQGDPGRNRTVEACRAVVQSEAAKVGGKEVEAVSGGPDRTTRDGRVFAPVHLRITYARPNGYEVREATMTCVVDRRGKIVDAYMAAL